LTISAAILYFVTTRSSEMVGSLSSASFVIFGKKPAQSFQRKKSSKKLSLSWKCERERKPSQSLQRQILLENRFLGRACRTNLTRLSICHNRLNSDIIPLKREGKIT
jgi:hypothetical protein